MPSFLYIFTDRKFIILDINHPVYITYLHIIKSILCSYRKRDIGNRLEFFLFVVQCWTIMSYEARKYNIADKRSTV